MYSALKRDGVPLYKLARRGIEVEREARDDRDHAARAARCATPERLDFAVDCSKGTYVRVLAADLGRALGTVAHLERLRRTAVGGVPGRGGVDARTRCWPPAGAPLPLVSVREALAGLRGVRRLAAGAWRSCGAGSRRRSRDLPAAATRGRGGARAGRRRATVAARDRGGGPVGLAARRGCCWP